ncbi:MAG TPA: hypothetical protein VEB65_08770 [Solirubrobacterales bacterium]|nr:hypothetical protein [Solirubrobacterales bacterium]
MSRRRLAAALPLLAALLLALLAAAPGGAETIQQDGVRLSFRGSLVPRELPRARPAPARISLQAGIGGVDGAPLPQLRRLEIALNRVVRIDASGLPVCHLAEIQPATTADARAACGASLVGGGRFAASVQIPEQVPYPSRGRIDAFSGRYHGRPAILLHVYGTEPAPASYTLPLTIERGRGEFGTVLRTSLARTTPAAGRVTGLSLDLGASYASGGRRYSYLSASCPAPGGSRFADIPFVRTRLGFADRAVEMTVRRSCRVSEPRGG